MALSFVCLRRSKPAAQAGLEEGGCTLTDLLTGAVVSDSYRDTPGTHDKHTHAHTHARPNAHTHTFPHTHTGSVCPSPHLHTATSGLLFCPSLNWGACSLVVQHVSSWLAVLEWSGEGEKGQLSQWRWVWQ